MENKENNQNLEFVPPVVQISSYGKAYSSNVYTFASRNKVELPVKIITVKKSSSSSQSTEDDDELNGIFYDVEEKKDFKLPELKRNGSVLNLHQNEYVQRGFISESTKRKYGITGSLLTVPIPIPSRELTRRPSLIF
tara:strand:- start:111 stop:521 length:411 start_codon:yes stop_codon:yes gene_type:complete